MKVNELMIGDWVLDAFGKPIKVRDIITLDNKYIAKRYVNGDIQGGGGAYCQREGNIEPIPLTPEILEKNGWVSRNINDRKWAAIYERKGYPDIWENIDGNLSIVIGLIEAQIDSVHELQRILRLCGLNDLADNFKV